jgi:hypothetical protein
MRSIEHPLKMDSSNDLFSILAPEKLLPDKSFPFTVARDNEEVGKANGKWFKRMDNLLLSCVLE